MTSEKPRRERRNRDRGPDDGMEERVVKISRVAKVVKGGRHLSFSAMVVVGDSKGKVGVGLGKADAVPDAVKKAGYYARKNMINVPMSNTTISHEAKVKYCGAEVMLRPASKGTGIVAGGSVRAVVELAGIKDILTKATHSTNPINLVKATFKALSTLRDPQVEKARRQVVIDAGIGVASSNTSTKVSVS